MLHVNCKLSCFGVLPKMCKYIMLWWVRVWHFSGYPAASTVLLIRGFHEQRMSHTVIEQLTVLSVGPFLLNIIYKAMTSLCTLCQWDIFFVADLLSVVISEAFLKLEAPRCCLLACKSLNAVVLQWLVMWSYTSCMELLQSHQDTDLLCSASLNTFNY